MLGTLWNSWNPLKGKLVNKNMAAIIGKTDDTYWTSLRGKVVLNKNVIITDMGDIHPFPNGPIIAAEEVYIVGCDKNFICYWLSPNNFPLAKKIVLNNHPCDHTVFSRYNNAAVFTKLIIPSCYRRYYEYWADPTSPNIILLEPAQFDQEVARFKNLPEEPLKTTERPKDLGMDNISEWLGNISI